MQSYQIAVFGNTNIDRKTYRIAQEVGKEIAAAGHILISGGLGGVMEASAKGATEAGGCVVGILPGDQFSEGNKYLTIRIPTGMKYARNQITGLSCHGCIVIGGSSGAYEEARRVWEGRGPVVVIQNTGSASGAAHTMIDREQTIGLAFPENSGKPYHIFIANTPKEAVKLVVKNIQAGYPNKN